MTLPLGQPDGGPLFLVQSAFCGLDPRIMKDRYADYWEQAVTHTRINIKHAVRNPRGYKGYGADCWGWSASHGPKKVHCRLAGPRFGHHHADRSTFQHALRALGKPARHAPLSRLPRWEALGAVWFRRCFSHRTAAGFQKPIWQSIRDRSSQMIENFRSGLFWKLFMSAPEIQAGPGPAGLQAPIIFRAKPLTRIGPVGLPVGEPDSGSSVIS
jgi:hypothetical protein